MSKLGRDIRELKTEASLAPAVSGPGPISIIWVPHSGTARCLSFPRSDCKEKNNVVTEGRHQAAEHKEVRVKDDLKQLEKRLGRFGKVGTEGRQVWQPTGILSVRNGSPEYKLEGRNQPKSQTAVAGPGI